MTTHNQGVLFRRIVSLLAAFALAGVFTPMASGVDSDSEPSVSPYSGDLLPTFPFCSWWVETSTQNSNILYPDTSAAYWTMPFAIDDDAQLTLRGYFPDTRYFSIQVYDESGQPDTSVGATGLTDYQLVPDTGSVNPWQTQDPYPSDPQTYTLTISSDSARPSDATNWLSMPSPSTGRIGWLMLRVYLPNTPPYPTSVLGDITSTQTPPFDLVAKLLPTVTVGADDQRRSMTLPQCSSSQGSELMATTSEGQELGGLLYDASSNGVFEGRKAALDESVSERLDSNGAEVRDCTTDADGCEQETVEFVRPTNKQTPYPNADSAYIAASYTLEDGEALVVMARLPTTPWNVDDGFVPTQWPVDSLQMRYVSFCNYLQEPPYPVVEVIDGDQTIWGCSNDVEIHTEDSDDVIVAVVTAPDQKPISSEALGRFVWLPTDSGQETDPYVFAIRNMLPNANFAESATNIETTDDAAAAAEVLKSYYPIGVICDVEALEELGPTECGSAHHRTRICSASSRDDDLTKAQRKKRLTDCIAELRKDEGDVDGLRHRAACLLRQATDCTGMALARAEFRKAVLAKAKMAHADLTDANLRQSNLSKAILHNAVARGADMSKVKASALQAHNADLSEVNFAQAVLTRASLVKSNLSGSSLRDTDASGADLRGANLRGSDLSGANLSGANLDGADLTGAKLDGANLSGASVHDAVIDKSSLDKATTTDVDTSTTRTPTAPSVPSRPSNSSDAAGDSVRAA